MRDRHKGKTVYIVGAGPQLNDISEEQFRVLENEIAIGLNRTFMRFRPRYFLSEHPEEVMVARANISSECIYAQPPHLPDIRLPNVTVIPEFEFKGALPRDGKSLRSSYNAAIVATHLAYVMGANRIVYVGVEQRNKVHFYTPKDKVFALAKQPYYCRDHTETFRAYFDILIADGVEIVSAKKDSVVTDAGARHMSIEEVLGVPV